MAKSKKNPSAVQLKNKLASRLYGEGVPYLPLPSVKRSFDAPSSNQRPVTAKLLRNKKRQNSMAGNIRIEQSFSTTPHNIANTMAFFVPNPPPNRYSSKPKVPRINFDGKRELIKAVNQASQAIRERDQGVIERRQNCKMYSTNNRSITGVSIVSALQPRMNISMDRTNIYVLKSATAQPQKRRIGLTTAKPRQTNERKESEQREVKRPVTNVWKKRHTIGQSFVGDYPLFESSVSQVQEVPTAWTNINKFIQALLEKQPAALSKFLYLNLKKHNDNPYELELTSYGKRNERKYYTISAKGVTEYSNEIAVDLVPLKEWLFERELYNEIKSFSFFKNFRRWKLLSSWRKKIWWARKKRVIEELKDKMFLLDPIYTRYIVQYRKNMYEMSKLRVIDLYNANETSTLSELNARQAKKRKEVAYKVKELSKKSRGNIRDLIKESLAKLREAIHSDKDATIITKSSHTTPNLLKTNTALKSLNFPDNMAYGHRAALRKECSRFLRLAYLADFMAIKSLSDVYINTIHELLDTLSYLDKNAQAEVNAGQDILRKVGKGEPIIAVEVLINMDREIPKSAVKEIPILPFNDSICKVKEFDILCHIEKDSKKIVNENKRYVRPEVVNIGNYWIETSPNKEDFYDQLLVHLSEGMHVLEIFERWSKHQELKQYMDVLEEWDEIVGGDWNPVENEYLDPIAAMDRNPLYLTYKGILRNIIYSGYDKCYNYLKLLDKYLNHCWRNKRLDVNLIFSEDVYKPGETLSNVLNLFEYQKKKFIAKIPETCNLGFIKIDCLPIRKTLIPQPIECMKKIEHIGNLIMGERLNEVEEWIAKARKKLEVKVITVEDYVKQRLAWNEIADAYKDNKDKVDTVGEIYDAMNGFELKIRKDDKQRQPKITQEMNLLNQLLVNVSNEQELNMDKFKRELQEELIPKLQENLELLKKEIEDEMILTYQEDVKEIIVKIDRLEERFLKLTEQCKKYNDYQERLNLGVVAFQIADVMKEELHLRKILWNSLKEWKEYTAKCTAQQFTTIEPKTINEKADYHSKIAFKVDRELPENPVSKQFKAMVDTFTKAVPIIRALRNEFLKKTHWKVIKELLNAEFEVNDENFTLQSLLELNAAKYKEEIQQISIQATRENKIENKIAAIDAKWKGCNFVVKEYKTKDEYILTNIDVIKNLFDQSMVEITAILEDKYVKPFLSQVEAWRKKLVGLINIMEEWSICQSSWIKLTNIFSSNEIRNQLTNEASKFEGPDNFFRELIQKAKRAVNPIRFLNIHKGDLLERIKHANKTMEEINRLLLEYVESKQKAFPRFYFLGSEEILKMLSNPQRLDGIKKYLPKLFDSVREIELNEAGDMIAVLSPQGERLKFYRSIRVKESIELCLEQVLNGIKEALMRLIRVAIKDYDEMERKDWICKHHCQIVLVIAKIVWCNATESTIIEQTINSNALVEWYEEVVKDIQQTIEVSKNLSLPLNVKMTIENSLITQMHFRDIIEDLVLNNTIHTGDYNWQKILRFYWEEEDPSVQQAESIYAKAISSKITYETEYIGPSSSIINNPSTDRAWLSIVTSLSTHMVTGLLGKNEAGKTEILKGLAKSMAMYFVPFNCPINSNYRLLSKLIIGAVQEGAWVLMEGIDLIDPTVLSVLARQLMEVRTAFEKTATTLILNEHEVQIKESCGIFGLIRKKEFIKTKIAGESFRIVYIMKPSIEHLLNILLISKGFNHTNIIAKKLFLFMQVSQGLLATVSIYYIKTIISVAEKLKRSLPEESALVTAIKSIMEPQLNGEKRRALDSILQDIFSYTDTSVAIKFEQRIEETLINKGLNCTKSILTKIMQMKSLLQSYTGIIIIGPAHSGKTNMIQILSETYNLKGNINLSIVNPKALSLNKLYGIMSSLTQEWIDGLLPKLLRDDSNTDRWILFDGSLTSDWTNFISTASSSTPFLSLGNGERIYLNEGDKVLFESDELKNVSPGVISRCGLINVDPLDYGSYLKYWLNKVFCDEKFMCSEYKSHLLQLFEQSIEKALSKIRAVCDQFEHTSDCLLVKSICNILEIIITADNFSNDKLDKKRILTQAYCFAFIWGIGGQLNDIERDKLDSLVRGLFEHTDVPTAQSIYEYYIDPKKCIGFRPWTEIVPSFKSEGAFWQLVVPTTESIKQEYFIENLVNKSKNLFIVGRSSCGKSLISKNFIERSEWIVKVNASFTSRTEVSFVQSCIEVKLQKKHGNLYGAPKGKKNVIFIDDAHLPLSNVSIMELLRQLMDKGGWYDRNEYYWKNVENTSTICISKHTELPQRLMQHFTQLNIPSISQGRFDYIFKTLLDDSMRTKEYPDTLQAFTSDIVSNTIFIYNSISEKLNPNKFLFTPRDLRRVFEGINMANPNTVNSVQSLATLWVQEFSRVFVDPMKSEADKDWIRLLLSDSAIKVFKSQADFKLYWKVVKNEGKKEIGDMNEVKKYVQEQLDQHILVNPIARNVILYEDMLELLIKILHELEMPRGYFFVVGNTGVGKFTLIKIALLIQGITLQQFKREANTDCVKMIFKQLSQSTGVQGKEECLMINIKSQAVPDHILETTSLFLLNGEIPGLFSQEETEKILAEMRQSSNNQEATRKQLTSIFTRQIQENFKLAFCCNIGKHFDEILRRHSTLKEQCRFIWASDWSIESIKAIGRGCLVGIEGCSSEVKSIMIDICSELHNYIVSQVNEHNERFNTCINIIPSFFIDALNQFRVLYNQMKKEEVNTKSNLSIGLSNYKAFKDKSSNCDIEFQRRLDKKTEESDKLQKDITEEQKLIGEMETDLSVKRKNIEKIGKTIKTINDEIENDLSSVKQELTGTVNELVQCDKKSISDIKTTKNPSVCMKLVMEATMTLLQEKTEWANIKILLSDPTELVGKIVTVTEKINTLNEPLIKKVKAGYLDNSEFNPEYFKGKTALTKPFAHWVKAVVTYYNAYTKTALKRQILEEERIKYNIDNEEIEVKVKELNERKEKLMRMKKSCEEIQEDRARIAEDMAEMKSRSARFEEFFTIFDENEIRWDMALNKQKEIGGDVIGNVLYASVFIVYLSQFSSEYRGKFISEFKSKIEEQDLKFDTHLYLKTLMEKQDKVESLFDNELPRSQFSVDNVIIALNSNKWPLMVDSYGFANKWIKSEYKNLIVLKFSQKDYFKSLVYAMRLGRPVLIEDIEDFIDPIIDPLLYKNIINKEAGTNVIYINNEEYEYEPSFKLFMTTRSMNLENMDKVRVINFDIDIEALKEIMLEKVIKQEAPEEDKERILISEQIVKDKEALEELDNKILSLFANGAIEQLLEDEKSYELLKATKKSYDTALIKLKENEELYNNHLKKREEYIKIVIRAGIIYSVSKDYSFVFSEHRFSLANFLETFSNAIELSLSERICSLKEMITRQLCNFMMQGMNKYHKIVFAFLLALKILEEEHSLSPTILKNLIKEDYEETKEVNRLPKLISTERWNAAQVIAQEYSNLKELIQSFSESNPIFTDYANNKVTQLNIKLTSIEQLLLASLFPTRNLYNDIVTFIRHYDLLIEEVKAEQVLAEGKKGMPVLILPSSEISPLRVLREYAEKKKCQDKLVVINLGQDQGQHAKRVIQSAQVKGDWIFIDNCHLAEGGSKELEMLMDQIKEPKSLPHEDFRVYFSSADTVCLPKSIIEYSIKLVLENPNSIRDRALKGYKLISDIESAKRPEEFKRILLGLCMFHAYINEQQDCFVQGYIFDDSYLKSAAETIKSLMEELEETLWNELSFAIAEILYGGVISIQSDKQLLLHLFQTFCCKDVLNPEYAIPEDTDKFLLNLADKDLDNQMIVKENEEILKLIKKTQGKTLRSEEQSHVTLKQINEIIDLLPTSLNVTVSL